MPPLPTIDEPPPPASLRTRAQVSAGAIDRKALKKPLPLYPSLAGVAHASGDVLVEILVDETGNVIAANALSGHPLLRQAAMQAAYEAEFAPIVLSGQAVTVYGTLSYNFAPR
jgi:TonB family protein